MPKRSKAKPPQPPAAPGPKAIQKAGSSSALFPDMEDVTAIVEFLANFRQLVDPKAQMPSKLISIKIPEPLLTAFRFKSEQSGVPYQTMIKRLMEEWLKTI